jgi:hypothetical protein
MSWSIDLYLFASSTYPLSANQFLLKAIDCFLVAKSAISRIVGCWMLAAQLVFGSDPNGLFYCEIFELIG